MAYINHDVGKHAGACVLAFPRENPFLPRDASPFSGGWEFLDQGMETFYRGMGTFSHRDVNRFTEGWEPVFPKDGAPLFRGIGIAFPTDGTPFPRDGNPFTEGWGHPFPSDGTPLPRDDPFSEGWEPLSRRMGTAFQREQCRSGQGRTGQDGNGRV